MGIIYKLKTEIKDYIIEEKNNKPILSCRSLVSLIESRFQIKVSKSSINAVIKESGLSMPVGRRRKKRRRKAQISIILPLQIENKEVEPPLLEAQKRELIEQLPEPVIERPVEEPKTEIPVEKIAQVPVEPVPEIPTVAPIDEEPEKPSEPLLEALPEKPAQEPMVKPQEAPAQVKAEEPVKPTEEVPSTIPTQPSAEILIELPSERECAGAILLKAADYLMGGSFYIAEAIKRYLNTQEPDLLAKTESLIYRPLFEMPKEAQNQEISGLWNLIGKKFSSEGISAYLNGLQSVKIIAIEILQIISRALQEIHCLKVKYADGSGLYLDGQMHTVWSVPNIPFDFSTTPHKIKSYIAQHFQKDEPLVLFTAPGYDTPTKEFFEFILNLESQEKEIASLTLCGNKLEELETIKIGPAKQRFFALGFWPWQFGQYRAVRTKEDFRIFHAETLKKDLYIAESEVELLQPNINKRLTLRGCLLKSKPEEKTRLIILTNLSPAQTNLEELASLYLNYWPNLEECFQDFSRKIELFTYTASARRFFSTDALDLKTETAPDIKGLLYYYLMALNYYVMWHFLPFGYEDEYFSTINERFYSLKARLKEEKEHILVAFQPPSDYPYLKDLAYACRRVNEREILTSQGKRLWLDHG